MTDRPRNHLWDALVAIFGYSPTLRREQKLWGQIVSEFREAEVTPDQLQRAARGYRRLYPQAAFTPTALRNQFSACLAEATPKRQPLRLVDDEDETTVPPPADLLAEWRGRTMP